MAAESMWDVQAAVFTKLTGTSGLTSLLAAGAASVLDHVPAGTAFPYVVLGESSAQPFATQGGESRDVSVTIHTYSQGAGMKQAKQIMAAIHGALHRADFTVSNQKLILCRATTSQTELLADGMTRHGVQTFRLVTEPA